MLTMKTSLVLFVLGCSLFISASCTQAQRKQEPELPREIQKTAAEWKATLTPQQYYVMRQKGTERAFTSPLNNNKKKGTYVCAGCKAPLFSSEHKFDSGTGWPSFYKPLVAKNVEEKTDLDLGMVRTEVLCQKCGGHLGHVFDDGPRPTGLRYCINGVSLAFEPEK
jgi:peptide-methionine (R)-S-oxide reductase